MPPERSNEWWTELAHAFESHVRSEAYVLGEYERLRDEIDDVGTKFLMTLIIEDERRHHAMFADLAESARGDGPGPVEPAPDREDAERLRMITERFLHDERDDRAHLRRIRRELGGRHGGLWVLLMDIMELDTQKHVRILEFLASRLDEAPTS